MRLLEGIGCSNGMTFSLDERFFFHTDSLARRITRYEYDRRTGEIESPRVFFQGDGSDGLPDGITMDAEDHLWIAFWGAAAVRRLDPGGKTVREIRFPARQVSSVMFGGPGLEDLYVTSAAEDAEDLSTGRDAHGMFLGGSVYSLRPGVRGRAEWPAAFLGVPAHLAVGLDIRRDGFGHIQVRRPQLQQRSGQVRARRPWAASRTEKRCQEICVGRG